MLVNLPNEMIGDAIARKLMSFFIISDKETKVKIMLCEMNADITTAKINTKYYPINGNEPWLSIFTDERDGAFRVSKDVITELKADKPSNTLLMNYAKAISNICMFTDVTMASSRSIDAPDLNTMLNETIEANKNNTGEEGT